MVEIHPYGQLRVHASDERADSESAIRLPGQAETRVRTVLEEVGIDPDDVCHVFLNRALLNTRDSMASWLRSQESEGEGEGLDTPVHDGDRLGLFGRDMALLML